MAARIAIISPPTTAITTSIGDGDGLTWLLVSEGWMFEAVAEFVTDI